MKIKIGLNLFSKPSIEPQAAVPVLHRIALLLVLLLSVPVQLTLTAEEPKQDPEAQISRASVFYINLAWLGPKPPGEAENDVLWGIMQKMQREGAAPNIPALEQFIATYPSSPWLPSLRANLARYYSEHGRYSKALREWEAVWQITGTETKSPAKEIADFTFAYWTSLLASLGRVETLRPLLKQTRDRQFDGGPFQQVVNETREAYQMMLSQPGDCFRCGTLALNNVAKVLKGTRADIAAIVDLPSPVTGFNLSKLADLAKEAGLDLIPAAWGDESELVLPSVIHWKDDHYAALVEEKGGRYRVVDPTFGVPRWLTPEAIRAEVTGHFLIPKDKLPAGWRILLASETDHIFGRGIVRQGNDQNDGCGNGSGGGGGGSSASGGFMGPLAAAACSSCGGSSGGGCCGGAGGGPGGLGGNSGPGGFGGGGGRSGLSGGIGMATWKVSEPYINAWLYDTPVAYETGLGYPVDFQIAYKQRDTKTFSSHFFGLGKMWNCSWLSYVTFETDTDPSVSMAIRVGGERTYAPDGVTPDYYSSTRLLRTVSGGGQTTGFVLSYPSGATDRYCFIPSQQLDMKKVALLSEQIDPAGHTNRFIYQETNSTVFLRQVIDADGRTNLLSYTNATYPAQITGVTDPFGRSAVVQYETASGMMTNVTDVQGLSSAVKYDGQGWATNLITPYGLTTFIHITNSYTLSDEFHTTRDFSFIRALKVIDAVGGTNFYMLRQDSIEIYTNLSDYTNQVNDVALVYPEGDYYYSGRVPFGSGDFDWHFSNYRDSFHWGPRQASTISADIWSLSVSDFRKARMRHWLHDKQTGNLGQTLSMEQAPSPDDGTTLGQTTWLLYDGQAVNYNEGDRNVPALVARVIPDGTTNYTWYLRDEWDRPTNIVESYSTYFTETPLTRTNVFVYAANGVDLIQQIGPQGETVAGYAYDGNHRFIRATNAVGDVTYFTYDTPGRLTSIKSPTGLTTTNIYFASGTYSNWVQTRIDLEISRTNSFTYANNLISTHTDERGLVTTNVYDNLQRPLTISDSRGTISYTYDKLDLVKVVDRMGFTNSYGYDALRRRTAATNALGFYTLYNYCACGSLDSIRDALGNYTYFYYDNAGRLITTVYPDGYSLTNNFDLLGEVTGTVDSAGYSVTNWFVNQGRQYAASDAGGLDWMVGFDQEDRATNRTDRNGVGIAITYDNLGRARTRTYPDNGMEGFGYSASGLFAYTNQIGASNFMAYDAAGRKTFETNANNELIQYTFSAAGDLLTLTDGKGHVTTWQYDQYGRLTNKLDQTSLNILRYQYDADDRLTNRWSSAKGTTTYAFDAAGNLTNIAYPSGTASVALSYDPLNRVTNMVDGVGTTAYTYDAAGQLLTEDGPFASDTVTNKYANRLRVALSLQQPAGAWTNGFGYDTTRRLATVTSPAGVFTNQYITGVAGGSGYSSHLLENIFLPNGSHITNYFDLVARLLETDLRKSDTTVLDSYHYVYNVANQRTNVTRADASTVGFRYDNIGQLTVADSSVNTEDRGYFYDAAWNLNRRTNNGVVGTFVVDNKNELTNGPSPVNKLTCDNNGNTITSHGGKWVYSYDAENRLVQWFSYASSPSAPANGDLFTQFIYDGIGRLRERIEYVWNNTQFSQLGGVPPPAGGGTTYWQWSSETHYIYDGMRVIQERDTNNTPTVSYTRGNDLSGTLEGAGGIGGLLGRSDGYSGGNWTDHNYYFADGNGNVTYLANSSQGLAASYRCDPFGNLISSSGTLASGNVYRFSSKEIHVNSGMYYYLYRFYDPNLQRWLSRDPLEEPGFKVMLAALVLPTDSLVSLAALVAEPNSYTFVDNTPISQVDYLGLIRSSYPAPDTGRSDPSPMPSPCGDFTNKDCREACDTAFGSKNAALQVCYKICKALKGKSCNALYRYCTHIAAHGDFGSQGGKICLGMYDVLCAGR